MIRIREEKEEYRSTMIVGFVGFALFLFSVSFHFAFASAVVTIDDSYITISQNIGINIDCSLAEDFTHRIYTFMPSGVTMSDSSCNLGVPYYFDNWTIQNNTSWTAYPSQLGIYEMWYIPSSDEYPTCIDYLGTNDEKTQCLLDFPTMYKVAEFTVNETGDVPASSASIWGNDNGFWGETTPTMIVSDMTASVQNTGASLWPLFAFVGIGLAFVIAGMLVLNIKKQVPVARNKKETINPQGHEFIEHSVEDREFVRNYGQETVKRKRGRPRKVEYRSGYEQHVAEEKEGRRIAREDV